MLEPIIQLTWAPFGACAISCAYLRGWTEGSMFERIALSAHGAVLGCLYLLAWVVGAAGFARQSLALPFALAFLLPTALVGAALVRFRGNKAVHLLLLPLAACAAWIWFVGTMAITGEWL